MHNLSIRDQFKDLLEPLYSVYGDLKNLPIHYKDIISKTTKKAFNKWMGFYEWTGKHPRNYIAGITTTILLPLFLITSDFGQGNYVRLAALYSFTGNMIGAGIYKLTHR